MLGGHDVQCKSSSAVLAGWLGRVVGGDCQLRLLVCGEFSRWCFGGSGDGRGGCLGAGG